MTRNLFDQIPTTLFNPLASPNAPLYAAVLLRLFAETQRHYHPLSRDLVVYLIIDILEELPTQQTLEGADDEEQPSPDHAKARDARDDGDDGEARDDRNDGEATDDLRDNAGVVLRYLATTGSLRVETQSDYTIAYTMPAHAFCLFVTKIVNTSCQKSYFNGVYVKQ
jgi:hypothetical protein